MKWTDVPIIFRLVVAIGVVIIVLKVGYILIGYLLNISIHDNPPEKKNPEYELYMLLSLFRKTSMVTFYIALIMEILFIPLVINHVSNASIGHLILFGFMATIGMVGNVFGLIKQRQIKR